MRKLAPVVAAAAFLFLASDVPVSANQVSTDVVDIMDVDQDSDVVGFPDGNPPPRWYLRNIQATIHAAGPIFVPPDPVVPPDPCNVFRLVWNILVDVNMPAQARFKLFTRMLQRFEQFGCRVEIDFPSGGATEVDALEIRPTAD